MRDNKFFHFILRGALIALCLLVFSGCSLGNIVENKIEEKFEESQNNTINIWENQKIERDKKTAEEIIKSGITDEMRNKIDKWIDANGLNKYGDKKGMMYAGGTPLFNEATGEIMDRHGYILKNHPGLVNDLELK